MLPTHLNNFFASLGRNVKHDLLLIERDYKKVMRVIRSCKTEDHLVATNRLITLFYLKHDNRFLLKKW